MTRRQATGGDAKRSVTPKLRFPEFRNDPGWSEKTLDTLAAPVSARAENEDDNTILTLSSEHGLMLQREYFGKQVAGTNADRYLKIQRDDFVYNDRTTKASAYGTIKRLTKHPHGIVSPIYKCFRFKQGELPAFWEWYFEAGANEAELRGLANEGARAGRFNVSIDRFLSTRVSAPDSASKEQAKIADCLSTLEALIGAESQKLNALKTQKKGLMQQLFPSEGDTRPRHRFPEFRNAPEWTKKTMERVLIPVVREKEKPTKPYTGLGLRSHGKGTFLKPFENPEKNSMTVLYEVKADDLIVNITFAWEGAIAIARKSDDGALVSHRFPTYIIKGDASIPSFLRYVILDKRLVHNLGLISPGGAGRNRVLNKNDFLNLAILLPDIAEQQRIAMCLASLDDVIAAQSDKLEALKNHKKGLMKQLFP